MADDAVTPAPAAPAATGTAPNDPETEPQSLTFSKEDRDEIQSLKKTVNSLAAMLRKANTTPAPTPAPVATTSTDDDEKPTTQRESIKKLIDDAKAREARLDAKEKAREQKIRKSGIRQAIADAGVAQPEHRELLQAYLEQTHGSKISVDDEDNVLITDDLEQSKGIAEFIDDFLKTPKGKLFKPEKTPGPNTRAGRGASATIPGQKSIMEMSVEERQALKPEERSALYRQAMQTHKS